MRVYLIWRSSWLAFFFLCTFGVSGDAWASQKKGTRAWSLEIDPVEVTKLASFLHQKPIFERLLRPGWIKSQLTSRGLFSSTCSLRIKGSVGQGTLHYIESLRRHRRSIETLHERWTKLRRDRTLSYHQALSKFRFVLRHHSWFGKLTPRGHLLSVYVSLCPKEGRRSLKKLSLRALTRPWRRAVFTLSPFWGRKAIDQVHRKESPKGLLWRLQNANMQTILQAAPAGRRRWSLGIHFFRRQNPKSPSRPSWPSLPTSKVAPHPKQKASQSRLQTLVSLALFPKGINMAFLVASALEGEYALRHAIAPQRALLRMMYLRILGRAAQLFQPTQMRASARVLSLRRGGGRLVFGLSDRDRDLRVTAKRAATLASQAKIASKLKGCMFSLAFGLDRRWLQQTPIEKRLFGKPSLQQLQQRVQEAGYVFQATAFAGGEWLPTMARLRSARLGAIVRRFVPSAGALMPTLAGFCLKAQGATLYHPLAEDAAFQRAFASLKQGLIRLLPKGHKKPWGRWLRGLRSQPLPKQSASLPSAWTRPLRLFHMDGPLLGQWLAGFAQASSSLRPFFSATFARRAKYLLLGAGRFFSSFPLQVRGDAKQHRGWTTYTVSFFLKGHVAPPPSSRPTSRPASRPTSQSTQR